MADVSISNLTPGTPTGTDVLPYSNGSSTQKVQIQSLPVSWNSVTNKPSLATVATTGNYNDLINKPTIPSSSSLVRNVVYNNYTAPTTINTTNTDTGLNASITLSSDSSRVLIRVEQALFMTAAGSPGANTMVVELRRNNSFIYGTNDSSAAGSCYMRMDPIWSGDGFRLGWVYPLSFIDTPGSVGPHTYKITCRRVGGSSSVAQQSNAPSSITLMEITS